MEEENKKQTIRAGHGGVRIDPADIFTGCDWRD
jgi:hypothetical protein